MTKQEIEKQKSSVEYERLIAERQTAFKEKLQRDQIIMDNQ